MNFSKYTHLFILLCSVLWSQAIAQPETNTSFSDIKQQEKIRRGYVVQLHEGILVFRLSMYGKKLKKLEEMLAADNISQSFQEQISSEIEDTKAKRLRMNTALVKSLRSLYTFSKVYFIPDSLANKLKEGATSGIFLNDNLELDPSITLTEDKPVFIGYVGTSASDNKFIRLATVEDEYFGYVKMYNFWELMNYTGDDSKFVPKAIIRLEKYIYKTYDKIISTNNYTIE